ncbi:MAG: hypothetical protein V1921_00420 [Candidatus Altiarchaeota archaeon]
MIKSRQGAAGGGNAPDLFGIRDLSVVERRSALVETFKQSVSGDYELKFDAKSGLPLMMLTQGLEDHVKMIGEFQPSGRRDPVKYSDDFVYKTSHLKTGPHVPPEEEANNNLILLHTGLPVAIPVAAVISSGKTRRTYLVEERGEKVEDSIYGAVESMSYKKVEEQMEAVGRFLKAFKDKGAVVGDIGKGKDYAVDHILQRKDGTVMGTDLEVHLGKPEEMNRVARDAITVMLDNMAQKKFVNNYDTWAYLNNMMLDSFARGYGENVILTRLNLKDDVVTTKESILKKVKALDFIGAGHAYNQKKHYDSAAHMFERFGNQAEPAKGENFFQQCISLFAGYGREDLSKVFEQLMVRVQNERKEGTPPEPIPANKIPAPVDAPKTLEGRPAEKSRTRGRPGKTPDRMDAEFRIAQDDVRPPVSMPEQTETDEKALEEPLVERLTILGVKVEGDISDNAFSRKAKGEIMSAILSNKVSLGKVYNTLSSYERQQLGINIKKEGNLYSLG